MDRPKKRILVAEDDPAIRDLIHRTLSPLYDVVCAEDGPGAIALASASPAPQLVLLDVMMPGIDGFAVAQRLRMLPGHAKTPVIFLTARDAPMDMVRGIQSGARHYITKPFAVKDLLDKVRKTLSP